MNSTEYCYYNYNKDFIQCEDVLIIDDEGSLVEFRCMFDHGKPCGDKIRRCQKSLWCKKPKWCPLKEN